MKGTRRGRTPAMARKPGPNTEQFSLRIPTSWTETLDEIARVRSEGGLALTRADAIRIALFRGIQIIAEEEGLKKPE